MFGWFKKKSRAELLASEATKLYEEVQITKKMIQQELHLSMTTDPNLVPIAKRSARSFRRLIAAKGYSLEDKSGDEVLILKAKWYEEEVEKRERRIEEIKKELSGDFGGHMP